MRVFHAVMSEPEFRAIRIFNDGELDMLISANVLDTDSRWKKNLELLHAKKNMLIADSGMIGFVKRLGISAVTNYAMRPDRVLELQLRVEPDVVVMTDLLLFPKFLSQAGISKEKAISINRRNALFLAERDIPCTKVFVIQGETMKDYLESVEWYEREGFFSLENSWFGIGSVAFRNHIERKEIVRRVMAELPEGVHIHVFGIGSPKYLLELKETGVASVDSTMACMSGFFFIFIDGDGERKRLQLRKKDKYMTSALIAYNIATINMLVREGIRVRQHELFEVFDGPCTEFDLPEVCEVAE